ncbi:MAG: DUF6531 domain-containing protein [Deltaproteobacteria bacterium]|nr:DUF6531 domain-containing protein [Deltaproteobacteria bacterium]
MRKTLPKIAALFVVLFLQWGFAPKLFADDCTFEGDTCYEKSTVSDSGTVWCSEDCDDTSDDECEECSGDFDSAECNPISTCQNDTCSDCLQDEFGVDADVADCIGNGGDEYSCGITSCGEVDGVNGTCYCNSLDDVEEWGDTDLDGQPVDQWDDSNSTCGSCLSDLGDDPDVAECICNMDGTIDECQQVSCEEDSSQDFCEGDGEGNGSFDWPDGRNICQTAGVCDVDPPSPPRPPSYPNVDIPPDREGPPTVVIPPAELAPLPQPPPPPPSAGATGGALPPPSGNPNPTTPQPPPGKDEGKVAGKDSEPVLFYSGEFVYHKTDLEVPTNSLPMNWERIYRSQLRYNGPIGNNWTFNYNIGLKAATNGMQRFGPGGDVQLFTLLNTIYISPKGMYAVLSRNPDNASQYFLNYANGSKETYGPETNAEGWVLLTKMEDRFGNQTVLTYASGKLNSIANALGFRITIEYNPNGKISRVTSGNKSTNYTYVNLETRSGQPAAWVLKTATVTPTASQPRGTTETYNYDYGHFSDSTTGGASSPADLLNYCSNSCDHGVSTGCEASCNQAIADCPPQCNRDCLAGCESCASNCDTSVTSNCEDAWPDIASEIFDECQDAVDESLTSACERADFNTICEEARQSSCENEECGDLNGEGDTAYRNCTEACINAHDTSECVTNADGACQDWIAEYDVSSTCDDNVSDSEDEFLSECHSEGMAECLPHCDNCPGDCSTMCGNSCNSNSRLADGNSADCLCTDFAADCFPNCVSAAAPQRDACRDGCFNQNFVWGAPENLNFNLVSIIDSEGNRFLNNTYGQDVHNVIFDRVVTQIWGGPNQTLSLNYAGVDPLHGDMAPDVTATDRVGNQTLYKYNERGLVAEKTMINGGGVTYRYMYNNDNETIRTTFPKGNYITYEFDDKLSNPLAHGNLLSVKAYPAPGSAEAGQIISTSFTYEPTFNQISGITTPRGNVIRYVYDTADPLRKLKEINYPSITTPGGQVVAIINRLEYNAAHQIMRSTDPMGIITNYTYNAKTAPTAGAGCGAVAGGAGGLVNGISYGGSIRECFTYNVSAQLIEYTDTEQRKWNMASDARDLPVSLKGPMEIGTTYKFDPYDNIKIIKRTTLNPTSPLGSTKETNYSYDLLSNLTTVKEQINGSDFHAVNLGYNKNDVLQEIKDPMFGITSFKINFRGDPFEETRGSATLRYEYDENGNVRFITDAEGNRSEIVYDGFDRAITYKDSETGETHLTLDADSNVTTLDRTFNDLQGAARHESVSYQYDAMGWIGVVNNNGATTKINRNAAGKPTRIEDPNGLMMNYDYDALGRAIKIRDSIDRTQILTYNSKGQIDSVTVSAKDDVTGSRVTQTQRFEYDALGRRAKVTAPDGSITTYKFDGFNQPIRITYANGSTEENTYDGLGRIIRWSSGDQLMDWKWRASQVVLQDGIGGKTTTTLDTLGRILKMDLPNGGSYNYTYNKNDCMTGWRDPDGSGITQTVTPSCKPLLRDIALGANTCGTTHQEFKYFGGYLGYGFDNNDPGKEDDVTIALDYNAMGYLNSDKINTLSTIGRRDGLGNLTSLDYPTGRKVLLQRDAGGRLMGSIVDGFQIFSYKYSGFIPGEIQFPKTKDAIQIDAAGRVSGIQIMPRAGGATPLAEFKYGYDMMSQAENITGKNGAAFSIKNKHDKMGQILEAQIKQTDAGRALPERFLGKFNFNYDKNGNRKVFDYIGARNKHIDYAVDAMSQYTRIKDISPKYDKRGNMIENGDRKFCFDFLNRIRQVNKEKPTVSIDPGTGVKGPVNNPVTMPNRTDDAPVVNTAPVQGPVIPPAEYRINGR